LDFKVNVDVKKLFSKLCSECQEVFLDMAELKPDRESMRVFFQAENTRIEVKKKKEKPK